MMNRNCHIAILVTTLFFIAACQKNTVSKIPKIALIQFVPDSMKVNVDTCFIQFSLTDGDGDIGNSNTSQIWLKDSRFDTADFQPTAFPPIDGSVEDPKKGLTGTCIFYPVPQPVPRSDSNHTKYGDTLYYEMYITDRAGNASNHVITHTLIIRP